MDSNHRRRKPADLQSAPFGHSGIAPKIYVYNPLLSKVGANLKLFFYTPNFYTQFQKNYYLEVNFFEDKKTSSEILEVLY
jgi:hypothetical protein